MTRKTKIMAAGATLAGAAAVLLLVGASLRTTSSVPWKLVSVSEDGRKLTVQIQLSGSAGRDPCMGFDHVRVDESPNVVTVRAFVWRRLVSQREACTAELGWKDIEVNLSKPLDGRELSGCLQRHPCGNVFPRGWLP